MFSAFAHMLQHKTTCCVAASQAPLEQGDDISAL